MTLKLIFNITLTFIIIYIFFIYSVENVENTTSGQTNTQFSDQQTKDIKNIINDLYMTDVDAIRNLSDVATKLQTQNKLILPGQLNVQGKLATNDLDPSNMPAGWTGGLRFIDGYASGNMGFGPDGSTINAQINRDGDIMGKNLNLNGKIVTNDLTFNNSFTSGNMSFGPNDTTVNAQIKNNGNIEGYNLNLKGGLSFVSFIKNATTINAQIDNDGNISGNKLILKGNIETPIGHTIQSAGTQHIQGNGALYILYKDGLIVGKERGGSGNVSIQGKLQVGEDIDGNNLNLKGKIVTNDLIFTNGFTSGNMAFGPDGTTINAQINKDGNINGKKLTFIDGYSSGNMVFGPNATTINAEIDKNGNITGNNLISKGNLRLLNGGNLNVDNGSIGIVSSTDNPVHLKLINTLKLGNDQALQWSISNINSNGTIKNDNKLSFSRTPANNTSTYTPSLELYDSGDVNIPGNLKVKGNMGFGPDETKINAQINKDGNITGNNLTLKGNLEVQGNLEAHTIKSAGRQHITGNEILYILNKNGLIVGKEWGGSGDVSIQGNLTVNGDINNILTRKNRARFIRVGNMKSTDIFTETDFKRIGEGTTSAFASMNSKSTTSTTKSTTSTATDTSFIESDWTLIEIRVFDDTGTNIALGKNVIWKSGTRYRGLDGSFLYNPTNITNGKISIINEYDTTYLGDMYLNGYQGEGKNPLHQLEIDLEGEYNISQIQLFNTRIPSFTKRMNDTIVELITGDINKPETLIVNRRINTGLWDGIYSKEFIL